MDGTDVTLIELLDFDGRRLSPDQLESLGASRCIRKLGERVPRIALRSLAVRMSRSIAEALASALSDIHITDVLVGSWNKYSELLRYTDSNRYGPEEIIEVALGDHTVHSSHEPHIEILLNGEPLTDVRFEVDLEINVESAILTIRDARIRSISTGRCKAKATLKCEGAVLAESTKTFTLPGVLSFDEGIPIVPQVEQKH